MQRISEKTERIYGADLLRVILSFCVIVLHVMHYGGMRSHANPEDPGYYILWSLGVLLDCTVNCFIILSGFVMYDKRIKYTNIFRIYLTVLYHGLLVTGLFGIFAPMVVTDAHWINALCPVVQTEFWYFTGYFGLFILMPVLVQGMRALSNKQADLLALGIVVVFSILPTVSGTDPFYLNTGDSMLWLVVMFLLGTYLKKRHEVLQLKRGILIAVYLGCMLITCICVVLSVVFPSFLGMRMIEYTSPTIVLAAMAIVLLFASASVPKSAQKFLTFSAPLTLGIYLLHEHPLVRQYLIMDRFLDILTLPVLLQICAVLGIAALIWILCFFLEIIRQGFFSLIRIETALKWLEKRFFKSNDS